MNKSVALVLSSGGSKGLAHIGVINELVKQGFQITSVAGSSIGSVIGGVYAIGKLPEYTDWLKKIDRKTIWGLLDFAVSNKGLLKGEKVFEKMKTFIPETDIEKLRIPFAAVATDILNEKEVVFNTGSFYNAIRASVAIPTIFTPVKYNDTILVDGGLLSPIPIEYVSRQSGDILVVVNLYGDKKDNLIENQSPGLNQKSTKFDFLLEKVTKLIDSGNKKSLSYFSLLSATTNCMLHRIAKQSIEIYNPDIYIEIPFNSADTFDFHKADELIKIGELAANEAIIKYFKI